MRFHELYASNRPVISFEVFPPRSEDAARLLEARLPRLKALRPAFISVTYGALGSQRDKTLEIALRVKELGLEVAHHLTCVGAAVQEIDEVLERIREAGISNIIALRGDPPKGSTEFRPNPGGFRYAAELVRHIRSRDGFGIAVAGYPETHVEAEDAASDLRHLKTKVDAGADAVITQLFYDNSHYFNFVARCREIGIQRPIVPGLLPILDLGQVRRITQVCGSSIPLELAESLEAAADDPAKTFAIGIEHTTKQALGLLEAGVPGIHFYVLNRYFHIAEIMDRIRRVKPEL